MNADGSNITRITEEKYLKAFCWVSSDKIAYLTHSINSTLNKYELYIKNIDTGTNKKITSFEAEPPWLFFDKTDRTFLVIEQIRSELSLIIHLYNADGKELIQKKLTNQIFKEGIIWFDWIRLK